MTTAKESNRTLFWNLKMPDVPRLSAKEAEVVSHLKADGESYGIDLVRKSDGLLKRGTVYIVLDGMEEKGIIESRQESATPAHQLPRRLYRATRLGEQALAAHST